MKFSLNSRQSAEYLKKADEIKVEYRDRDSLLDLGQNYPDKEFVLINSVSDGIISWKDIQKLSVLTHNHLTLCLSSIDDCLKAKENNIPFYLGFPVSSWYEAQALKELGVSCLVLGAPLFFDMKNVASLHMPIRLVPNVACLDDIPREDGINGTWIRPENLDEYASYVEDITVEFLGCNIQKEQAMYRIYAEQKNWPGELDMLIDGLNYSALNRVIDPKITAARLTCHQTCAIPDGACSLCYRVLAMAKKDFIQSYAEQTSKEE